MSGLRILQIASVVAFISACDMFEGDGCGGGCPFAEPTHHAVVRGVVFDLNDQPLRGIYSQVSFRGEQGYSGVGTQSDANGRFTVTARTNLSENAPDTASGWVYATQATPPPAKVVTDSVAVLLRFTLRSQSPEIVEVTIHLPVTP
jgi:hypothetical protein